MSAPGQRFGIYALFLTPSFVFLFDYRVMMIVMMTMMAYSINPNATSMLKNPPNSEVQMQQIFYAADQFFGHSKVTFK